MAGFAALALLIGCASGLPASAVPTTTGAPPTGGTDCTNAAGAGGATPNVIGSWGPGTFDRNLHDPAIIESSGLVASTTSPGILFTHNDSGDTARFFAVDRDGNTLGTYTLMGATAKDWEDMGRGPGPGGLSYLYLADIGSNSEARTKVVVYRVLEPTVDPAAPPGAVTIPSGAVEKFTLTYPDGGHNSESILLHPTSGELVVVSKAKDGVSGIYSVHVPLTKTKGFAVVFTKVGTHTFAGHPVGRLATGGSVSADGTLAVVRTYFGAGVWEVDGSIATALATTAPAASFGLPLTGQGEGIAFAADRSLLTSSEGSDSPVYRLPYASTASAAATSATSPCHQR